MRLTTRDFNILVFLYEQGVATFRQIREKFFVSDSSAWVRLHILTKNRFIASKSISALKDVSQRCFLSAHEIFLSHGSMALSKVKVYQLGDRFQSRFQGNEVLTQVEMWKHQVRLRPIGDLMKREMPDALILTDPEIREQWRHFKMGSSELIPDLVIQSETHKIAIELERNLKSENTYFGRFLAYRDSSYSHVIYFCESDRIFKALSQHTARFSKIGVASILSPEKIFRRSVGFETLGSFLGKRDSHER